MSKYAEWFFRAHGCDKGDRQTRLEKWTKIKERKGIRVELIDDAPRLNAVVGYVWQMYWNIKRGAEHVDVQTIAAWQQITGVQFSQFEVDALIEIDIKRRFAK